MTKRLEGKNICIFVANIFEDTELFYPKIRLKEEGANITIVGEKANTEYKGKHGLPQKSDKSIDEVSSNDFDCLVIPGGFSPDYMRLNEKMVKLVKDMHGQGKPIAAICHGVWMLAEADIIGGKRCTSYWSIKTDIKNAGGKWEDKSCVVDDKIITSRCPDDLIDFCQAICKEMEATKK